MKNLKKIISAIMVLAVMLSFCACSDLPKSSSAQWGYRYGDYEYPIGIHVYSVFTAYSQAYNTIAEVQGDEFDEEASILDVESTFDEVSGVMVCRDWIKEEAHRITRSLIGLDLMIDKYEIVLDPQLVSSAKEQARADWYLGPYYEEYVSYGSTSTPYKDLLEPYGISFDSFYEGIYLASVKQNAIFDKFYNKGGVEEVPEKEINAYFEKNYTSYGCFTVNFYESTTDSVTGQNVNKPFDAEKTADIKSNLEYYVKMIANGTDINTIGSVYAAYAGLDYNPVYENVEITSDGVSDNLPDEVVEILNEMNEGEAKAIFVGKEESTMAYFICKTPVKEKTEKFVKENYSDLLQTIKADDFFVKMNSFNESIQCEINTEVVDEFSPDLIEKILLKSIE